MDKKQLLREYINAVLESAKLNEAVEVHDTLNPLLWDDLNLKDDVKQALLDIANHFIENIGFSIDVSDIRFLGSNASYNYNSQSDIDLHIISNFDINYVDNVILQQLYNNEKNSFNSKHDITVKGIPVELYVEDMKSMNATNGSYSLLQDKWIKEPEPIFYTIPDYSRELASEIENIDRVLTSTNSSDIKAEINKIYLMRKDGLALAGEISIGNLVFKELRNLGKIKELTDKYYELESNELSLESEDLKETVTYRTVDFNKLIEIDPGLKFELESRSENPDYKRLYRRFLKSNSKKLRLNYSQLDLIAYIYENDPKHEQISEVLYGKQVNEWYNSDDITPQDLSSNPCKFVVINQQTGDRSENEFDNLRGVFTYVKQCGGFNTFKGLYWCIMSTYKDGEFYYIRDRFAKGGWRWEDCNGYTVGGFQGRTFKDNSNLSESEVTDKFAIFQQIKIINPNANYSNYKNKSIKEMLAILQSYRDDQKKFKSNNSTEDFLDSDEYKELMSQSKQKHVYYDASYDYDESNEAKDEIRKQYNESLNKLEQRLSGDILENALDLISELESVGANIDDNGYVTVYHQTTPRAAKQIIDSGCMMGKEDGIFFSTSDKAQQAEGRGTTKLTFKIPVELLHLDDIFSDNADVKINANVGEPINVSNYLIKSSNISEQLTEATLTDIINDSKSTDPKRIELSKSLYTEYKGVDSDGTLLFETDSQTRSGLGHKQYIFYEGFFDLLDKVDQHEEITEEDVLDILTGDVSLRCNCESFLYFAWAYKSWKDGYGLQKELRAPQRNNVNLAGGTCKHCLSVLDLINHSNTLFDRIAKDLNNLFQHYKKRYNTEEEIKRLQAELKTMQQPDLKLPDNNDNQSNTKN